MGNVFKVIALDIRTGSPVEQDITAWVDIENTIPPKVAWDSVATGQLQLTKLDTFTAYLDHHTEIWMGWRDATTDEWQTGGPFEIYLAFVDRYISDWETARHQGTYALVGPEILLATTSILTWPTDIAAAEAPVGFPVDKTVRDWLIGTPAEGLPPGILPFHFPFGNVNFGGVEPVMDAIFFNAGCYPSMSIITKPEEQGMWGFLTLFDLLAEIVKATRYRANEMGLDIRPSISMQALAVGTTLLPRFCFADRRQDAQDVAYVATYRINPGAGEWKIGGALTHERDPRGAQTGVVVMADGDRALGMIYSVATNADVTLYPTRYHRLGFWGGPVILNSDITTQAECDAYAQRVIDMAVPVGTIRFPADGPLSLNAGEYIMVDFPGEGQIEHILLVIQVERSLNPDQPGIIITCGDRPLDLSSVLRPPTDNPRIVPVRGGGGMEGQLAGTFAGGPGVVDVPRYRPLVNVATTPLKNVVQGKNNAVTAMRVRQTPGDAPAGTLGLGPLTVPPMADVNVLTEHWDDALADWVRDVWVDKNRTPHQQGFFLPFVADATYPFTMWQPITIRAAQMPSDPATHTTSYAISRNRAGTVTSVATVTWAGGVTVLSAPFACIAGDQVIVVASGSTAPSPLTLISGDPLT